MIPGRSLPVCDNYAVFFNPLFSLFLPPLFLQQQKNPLFGQSPTQKLYLVKVQLRNSICRVDVCGELLWLKQSEGLDPKIQLFPLFSQNSRSTVWKPKNEWNAGLSFFRWGFRPGYGTHERPDCQSRSPSRVPAVLCLRFRNQKPLCWPQRPLELPV